MGVTTGIECRVPIRIRLLGEPTDEDLARLEDAVARLVTSRMRMAAQLQAGQGWLAAQRSPDQAPYEAWRDQPAADTYEIPSYQRPPDTVRIPTRRQGTGPAPPTGRVSADQAALRRIHDLLTTGLLDWTVTDAEAREVLRILRGLSPEGRLQTVQIMRLNGTWNTFRRELPESDTLARVDFELTIDPNSGYLMPGDTIQLEVYDGKELQRELSAEYGVARSGVRIALLREAIPLVGLLPDDAAATIARAYVDTRIFTQLRVRLLVASRGSRYAPQHGATARSQWFESSLITQVPAHHDRLDERPETPREAYNSGPRPPFLEHAQSTTGVAAAAPDIAELRRRLLRQAGERAQALDWDAATRKFDEALRLMMARVWRMPDSRTTEDNERGVGYLIQGSTQERAIRDRIARDFLHDLTTRMAEPGFTQTSASTDFYSWLHRRPEYQQILLVAQTYPDVDQYDAPIHIPEWQTAIEIAVGLIPIVGAVVGGYEAVAGEDMFGHALSTTDRAIIGAAILLPVAAKVFRLGRGAVTASRIASDYRLSSREADMLFRSVVKIQPGSANARLLSSAAGDVKAGRPVRDPARLRQIEDLLREMGMTDRASAQELRTGGTESGKSSVDVDVDIDIDQITRPEVKGGQRPRIDNVPVPTRRIRRLDIGDFTLLPGETTQTQALGRIQRLIGKKINETPLGPVWEQARREVVGHRSLTGATRQEMFDLYNKVRNRFWDLARKDSGAASFLRETGFEFESGRAPVLRVTAPDISIQERRVSLDHNLEKALGDNYGRAIDADNLTFEFHNPNSNRETVQVKFGLRPDPGGGE